MANLEDEFGDVIAKARFGMGRTVDQLAESMHIPASDIRNIEAYRLTPEPDKISALAEALSLDSRKLAEMASDGWAPSPVSLPSGGMIVERIAFPRGTYAANCYAMACEESKLAAVIDPGGAPELISQWLADRDFTLDVVLVTHAHGDHIGGLRRLAADWPQARVINHQLERDSIIRELPNPWEPAHENVNIRLGRCVITPLFTPGHTPGSVCYLAAPVCFVGDTLFASSIGRPSSFLVYQQMLASIKSKVLSLPDDTILLPGHGPATTVGEEKAHNPFF